MKEASIIIFDLMSGSSHDYIQIYDRNSEFMHLFEQ